VRRAAIAILVAWISPERPDDLIAQCDEAKRLGSSQGVDEIELGRHESSLACLPLGPHLGEYRQVVSVRLRVL